MPGERQVVRRISAGLFRMIPAECACAPVRQGNPAGSRRGINRNRAEHIMAIRTFGLFCACLGLIVSTALSSSAADAPATDPAARQIAAFDDALLETMKQAKQLGASGRYDKLKPVIEETFDLPAMTSAAVGAEFASFSASDRRALVEAFTRMTVTSYAHNFDGYGGERFTIDANVLVRGDHKLVRTRLVVPKDKPHAFNYVMHQVNGSWKVIDILLEGYVSQAATKRSDFSATVASGGAQALIKKLNGISDGLLAGR
jgi:phospholipid transport system substrate-binding protein